MKLILTTFVTFTIWASLMAQETITESLGTGSNGASIASHETANGFDQDWLTYSGTGDLRTTSASSNGGFNVLLNPNENFIIDGLTPSSCTSIDISFLGGKSTNADNGNNLIVEYSTTGSGGTWNSAGTVTMPTGTGSSTGATPPTYHNISLTGLSGSITSFRFRNTSTTVDYRVDAISISGNGTGCVLPVALRNFNGIIKNKSTLLSFSTATELNNSHFVIERSADARTFSEIGRVQGAGTTRVPQSYTFTDEKPLSGLNYYRLRQVDFDGAESLSGVVSVVFGKAGSITIAPSPATDRVRIQLDEALTNDGLWQVFDNMGRQVLSGEWQAESADFDLDVNTLPEGMYTFRLAVGTQVQVKQFRKL